MCRNFAAWGLPLTALVIVVSVALGVGAPALAAPSPLFTMGFTDLDGDYAADDGSSGTFTAIASQRSLGGPFDTAGDVTRVFGDGDTARYRSGFLGLGTAADVQLTMDVYDVTSSTAMADGSFTVTDANGDVLTGTISGQWRRLGGIFGSFTGLASNVRFVDASGDGMFDGPSGGSFSTSFPHGSLFEGAIIVLETGSWFSSSFANRNTQIEAAFVGGVIPAPGAALLGAIGLGMVGMRRRIA